MGSIWQAILSVIVLSQREALKIGHCGCRPADGL